LGEFGVVAGQGTAQASRLHADIGADGWQQPILARETICELHDRLRTLDERIPAYDRKSRWAEALKGRAYANVATVALDAKNTRIIWAMLS
jgi:hypothetical protein